MFFWKQKIGSLYMISLVGLLILLLQALGQNQNILGTLSFFMVLASLSVVVAKKRFVDSRIESILLGFLLLFAQILLLGTALYYLYQITPLLSFGIFATIFLTTFLLPQKTSVPPAKESLFPKNSSRWFPLSILLLDVFLLFYLYSHQTTALSPSPWQAIGPIFFLVYFGATTLLFWHYHQTERLTQNILLTSLHFFVGIAITALLYPLGYGFDAFIHRATESWIAEHGLITPKQPYYIGQYALLTIVHHLTNIKVFFLDVFLVPVLSAILLPGIVISTTKKFLATSHRFIPLLTFWILACIPFLSLHLTTPHNLVVLLTLVLIFLSIRFLQNQISFTLPLCVALSTLATHPLIGAPNMIFVIALFFQKRFATKKILSLALSTGTFLGVSLLLPVLFTLNAWRADGSLPTLDNPFSHLYSFFELFQRPYWYATTSPWHLEILYLFERLLVPALLLLGVWGVWEYTKQRTQTSLGLFLAVAFGLITGAFLLRSWIVFPDVVAYEQGDYPLRLLKTSLLFFLPFIFIGTRELLQLFFFPKKKRITIISVFLLATILTLSLYLSYPQRNAKARFPGYNVTESDFRAVEWIHAQQNNFDYIVLSNQLVSAAALTTHSFAKYFDTTEGELFFYAIPTGGPLYAQYGNMIYEGQKREYMERAMDLVGVDQAYFVVNSYWANADRIIEGAQKTADHVEVIDENVWIFVYTRS